MAYHVYNKKESKISTPCIKLSGAPISISYKICSPYTSPSLIDEEASSVHNCMCNKNLAQSFITKWDDFD